MSAEDQVEPVSATDAPSPAPVEPVARGGNRWGFTLGKPIQLVGMGLAGVVLGGALGAGVTLALVHGHHRGHGPFDGQSRFHDGPRDEFQLDRDSPRSWDRHDRGDYRRGHGN